MSLDQKGCRKQPPGDLIERLCRSLAFHLVETELTLQCCDGDISEWKDKVTTAKALIATAGFEIDVLYPPADRPAFRHITPSGLRAVADALEAGNFWPSPKTAGRGKVMK